MSKVGLKIRSAQAEDEPILQAIREAAFTPVFASFRSILGDEIYDLAQAREDQAQESLLASMLDSKSDWKVYTVEFEDKVVGFVSVQLNRETKVGEIGLNAVHPSHAGKGIGSKMYNFSVAQMKKAGMKVATVATGGDPSHLAARKAYRKAGFAIEIPSIWMCQTL